jgi:hypothetical protein
LLIGRYMYAPDMYGDVTRPRELSYGMGEGGVIYRDDMQLLSSVVGRQAAVRGQTGVGWVQDGQTTRSQEEEEKLKQLAACAPLPTS